MGNGMNKVLPGLYVGNYRDSKDQQQLERHQISHIVAIHDSPRRLLPDKHYLCVMAADVPEQNLSQYFPVCNDFIHGARLRDGNVLIHCLAGMSRSVTVCVAYVMTVTNLNWKDALKVVRAGRAVANPNLGFQNQLQEFEMYKLSEERRRLHERFPSNALEESDREKCMIALNSYEELLQNRDICEGNCNRGEKCPTGVCQTDQPKGIFRRRPSSGSTRSSRSNSLKPPPNGAQSCPSSPKHMQRKPMRGDSISSSTTLQIPEDDVLEMNSSGPSSLPEQSIRSRDRQQEEQSRLQQNDKQKKQDDQSERNYLGLHRSASTVSSSSFCRPRSSPSGLFSYTGKASANSTPSSVHGSRVDITKDERGSAIYLGCNAPKVNGSSWSISSSRSSGGSQPATPNQTPPVSPRKAPFFRRSSSVVKKNSR
ncbi:dual specificity protein phosphatase 15 isoform X2 [Condylostylus longicornis]|uniref:dual specificity protein phosphatase 15 isoform X2 n=1 Tax=Condylostylus longicornis TaxID=2530218 RepID=UPI00244DBB59|nr:dual specificity protein phosphatase 15 isoform X2 [Condylostylus longicornis]